MPAEPVSVLKGSLDVLILRALAAGPTHGYGVLRWIEDATDAVIRLDEGSLYPALYRLEDRGWVASDWGTSANNRRARFYRLTPRGRAQLRVEIGQFTRFTEVMLRALQGSPA